MLMLTLRRRLAILPVCFALALLLVGGTGVGAILSGNRAGQEVEVIGEALFNHQQGDMMHDALRSDVLAALLDGPAMPAAERDDLRREFAEHAATFRKGLKANLTLPLPETVKTALAEVSPALDRYITAAENLLDLALRDQAAARAGLAGFQKAFADLEERNEKVSTLIDGEKHRRTELAVTLGERAAWLVGLFTALTLASAVGLTIAVGRSITGPLASASAAIAAIGGGRRDISLSYRRDDEIGQVCRAVLSLQEQADALDGARETARIQRDADHGRLIARQQATEDFTRSVERIVDALGRTWQRMKVTADTVSASASQVNGEVSEVHQAAQHTSATVEGAAAAAAQLSSSIAGVGSRTAQASTMTGEAVGRTGQATGCIRELAEASQRIGDVVGLITSIASQTNLLALNATIEAARAGEAGKGFAVVASEVKNLASQTTQATEDIQSQITAIQSVVERAVQAMDEVVATVGSIRGVTADIAEAVTEQETATRAIAGAVTDSARSTRAISGHLGHVHHSMEKADEAAGELAGAAAEVAGQLETLRTEVAGYIRKIQAA